ncbi:MAG: hypothetical protein JNM72_20495 [Deltaproteobacteria bacterium]|nr:hypothetical protein [Deltaproteobacteria bacterium]
MLHSALAGGLLTLGLLFGHAALWSGLVAGLCAAGEARPLTWGLGTGPRLGALRLGGLEVELRAFPLGAWVRIGPADAPEAPPLAAGAVVQVALLALGAILWNIVGDAALVARALGEAAAMSGAGARLAGLAAALWAAPGPVGLVLLGAQGGHQLVGVVFQGLGRGRRGGALLTVVWAFVPMVVAGVWLFG